MDLLLECDSETSPFEGRTTNTGSCLPVDPKERIDDEAGKNNWVTIPPKPTPSIPASSIMTGPSTSSSVVKQSVAKCVTLPGTTAGLNLQHPASGQILRLVNASSGAVPILTITTTELRFISPQVRANYPILSANSRINVLPQNSHSLALSQGITVPQKIAVAQQKINVLPQISHSQTLAQGVKAPQKIAVSPFAESVKNDTAALRESVDEGVIKVREVVTPVVQPDGTVKLRKKEIIEVEGGYQLNNQKYTLMEEKDNNPTMTGFAKKFVVHPGNICAPNNSDVSNVNTTSQPESSVVVVVEDSSEDSSSPDEFVNLEFSDELKKPNNQNYKVMEEKNNNPKMSGFVKKFVVYPGNISAPNNSDVSNIDTTSQPESSVVVVEKSSEGSSSPDKSVKLELSDKFKKSLQDSLYVKILGQRKEKQKEWKAQQKERKAQQKERKARFRKKLLSLAELNSSNRSSMSDSEQVCGDSEIVRPCVSPLPETSKSAEENETSNFQWHHQHTVTKQESADGTANRSTMSDSEQVCDDSEIVGPHVSLLPETSKSAEENETSNFQWHHPHTVTKQESADSTANRSIMSDSELVCDDSEIVGPRISPLPETSKSAEENKTGNFQWHHPHTVTKQESADGTATSEPQSHPKLDSEPVSASYCKSSEVNKLDPGSAEISFKTELFIEDCIDSESPNEGTDSVHPDQPLKQEFVSTNPTYNDLLDCGKDDTQSKTVTLHAFHHNMNDLDSKAGELGYICTSGKRKRETIQPIKQEPISKPSNCQLITTSDALRDCIVRKTIHDCYMKGTVPTVTNIYDDCLASGLEISPSTVEAHLTSIGYSWVKRHNHQVLIEDHKLTTKRIKYLCKVKKHHGKNFVYVFVSDYLIKGDNGWKVTRAVKDVPGKAYVVLHAMSSKGSLSGQVLQTGVLPGPKGVRHIDVVSWLTSYVLPKVPKGSIVILGNHHVFDKNVESSRKPHVGWTKNRILSWLKLHQVPRVHPDVPKAMLLNKANGVVLPKYSMFAKHVHQSGSISMHLPKHHSDLNPIEFIWLDVLLKLKHDDILEDFMSREFFTCSEKRSSVAFNLVRQFETSYLEFDFSFDELFELVTSVKRPAKSIPACTVASSNTVERDNSVCSVCLNENPMQGYRCLSCRFFWNRLSQSYREGARAIPVCTLERHKKTKPPICKGCRRYRYERALINMLFTLGNRPNYVLPIPPVTEEGKRLFPKLASIEKTSEQNISK